MLILDLFQVHFSHRLTSLDPCPGLDQDLEGRALQADRVHAHMKQDFQSLVSHDSDGMLAVSHHGDLSADWREDLPVCRLGAKALAHDPLTEDRVAGLGQSHYLTLDWVQQLYILISHNSFSSF